MCVWAGEVQAPVNDGKILPASLGINSLSLSSNKMLLEGKSRIDQDESISLCVCKDVKKAMRKTTAPEQSGPGSSRPNINIVRL